MERIPVKANTVISVGYDANLKILEVEFLDHSVIQYLDFSIEAYIELKLVNGFDEQYFRQYVCGKYKESLVLQANH